MSTTPAVPRSLESLVEAAYDDLGPVERHIADLVLENPFDLATYNASELAVLAGASKATVSRFFRRLGFETFAEARASIRELRSAGVPVGSRVLDDDGPWGRQLAQEQENLVRAAASVPDELLDTVAELLADAGSVLVVGYRNSHPVALHLREQLTQARGRVNLAPVPGQTLTEELADLGPTDVVVCVGFRRRPRGFAAAVTACLATGAPVVLLADPGARRLHLPVTHRLEVPVDGVGAFDSYAAAHTVVCLLAEAVLERRGRAGRERIARLAALADDLGELEPR